MESDIQTVSRFIYKQSKIHDLLNQNTTNFLGLLIRFKAIRSMSRTNMLVLGLHFRSIHNTVDSNEIDCRTVIKRKELTLFPDHTDFFFSFPCFNLTKLSVLKKAFVSAYQVTTTFSYTKHEKSLYPKVRGIKQSTTYVKVFP